MAEFHDVLTGAMLAMDRSNEILSLWEYKKDSQQLTLVFASPELNKIINTSNIQDGLYNGLKNHIKNNDITTFFQHQEEIEKPCGDLYIQSVHPLEKSEFFFVKYDTVPYPFELHHRVRSKRVGDIERQITRNLIHEILTPINSIEGISGQLNDMIADQETQDLLSHHAHSCHTLKSHLSAIVNFISLRNGETRTYHKEHFNLLETLFSIMSKANRSITENNRQLTISLSYPESHSSIPTYGYSDLLEQMLLHLVDNAIKFTDDGGHIIITMIFSNPTTLNFSIEDNGCGINTDDIALLFRPFVLGNLDETRIAKGLGLGLASATECLSIITDNEDARLNLKSRIGLGSTFSFTIPFEKSDNKIIKEESTLELPHPPSHYTILVAEDNPTQQLIIKRLIHLLGFNIKIVGNGLETVGEYIRSDTHYDMILMDIQMPGISGHEATKLIREEEKERNYKKVPIIAITANIESEVHNESIKCGMDGHYGKPVSRLMLNKLIRKTLLKALKDGSS